MDTEPISEPILEIATFKAVKDMMNSGLMRRQIAERLGLTAGRCMDYMMLAQLPKELEQLWLKQKRGGEMKPFKISFTAIGKLHRAMRMDHGGSKPEFGAKTLKDGFEIDTNQPLNFDPNGGPEYKRIFAELSK